MEEAEKTAETKEPIPEKVIDPKALEHMQQMQQRAARLAVPPGVMPMGRKPVQVAAPEQPQEAQVIQLDQVTMLRIELLTTKERLNKARQQNMEMALLDLKKEEQQLQLEENRLIQEISAALKLPPGKRLRLMDQEKGLCKVE
jgi:hypothetical protein